MTRARTIAACAKSVEAKAAFNPASRVIDDIYACSFDTPAMHWLAGLGDTPSRLMDEVRAENAANQGEGL
jgi:hypothetical protein